MERKDGGSYGKGSILPAKRPVGGDSGTGGESSRLLLAQAYAGFNTASDNDLIESYIYEIQSLQARYSYLLRRRKALDPAPEALPVPEPQPALPVA